MNLCEISEHFCFRQDSSEPSMVCSGMKYATHRSRSSLLQGYLYMAVYFGLGEACKVCFT